MSKFSEFYGPEHQKELLQEAENLNLIKEALAGQQRHPRLQIWLGKGTSFLKSLNLFKDRLATPINSSSDGANIEIAEAQDLI